MVVGDKKFGVVSLYFSTPWTASHASSETDFYIYSVTIIVDRLNLQL